MIRKFIALLALTFMVSCASGPPSVNGQLKTAYQTVDAAVELTKVSLQRGRISTATAEKVSAQAKEARDKLNLARAALDGCKDQTPCNTYVALMQQLQPLLFELERQAREKQP